MAGLRFNGASDITASVTKKKVDGAHQKDCALLNQTGDLTDCVDKLEKISIHEMKTEDAKEIIEKFDKLQKRLEHLMNVSLYLECDKQQVF